jgi:hypothetical protein
MLLLITSIGIHARTGPIWRKFNGFNRDSLKIDRARCDD